MGTITVSLFGYAEFVYKVMGVWLVGRNGRVIPSFEVFFVGRIRVDLWFKADCCALLIGNAFLSRNSAIKEVANVNLQSGLVGIYLKFDSRNGGLYACSKALDVAASFENPIVVISVSVVQLLVILVDTCPDFGRGVEVKRSVGYRCYFSRSHKGAVYRCIFVSVDIKDVVGDWNRSISVEIELCMVCHIDNCRLVCCGRGLNVDGVVISKGIYNFGFYSAGISVVAIR